MQRYGQQQWHRLIVVPNLVLSHQIRVHFAHADHPVVGDATYGGKKRIRSVQNPLVRARLKLVKRQMLHAHRLVLAHPVTGQQLDLSAPMPEDFVSLLNFLKEFYSRETR